MSIENEELGSRIAECRVQSAECRVSLPQRSVLGKGDHEVVDEVACRKKQKVRCKTSHLY